MVKFDKHMYQDVILSNPDDEDWLKAYDRVMAGQADADVILEDEVLWKKEMLWVPDSMDLRKIILQAEHESKVAGHMCWEKRTALPLRNFIWPWMDQWIENYVFSCSAGHQKKAVCYACYGRLQSLQLAY
jgi:hypothetical protein